MFRKKLIWLIGITLVVKCILSFLLDLGNDEVYYNCWKSNPNISDWMKKMNMYEYHELEAYYSKKILEIANELNYKTTVWQGIIELLK
jgi:hexosaminidase